MTGFRTRSFFAITLSVFCGPALAQDVNSLVSRGGELFNADIGCWVCHAETGEGLVGPSLHFGPTPVDIFDQLESNPVMGVIVSEMNPSDDDLVAISMYIRTLADLPLDPNLPDYPIAFVQGRRSFRWTQAERKAIRRFIENGGVLFADAICAQESFAKSFRQEMRAIFPDHHFHRIPPQHAMFTTQYHGHDLSTVTLRDPRIRWR